MSRVSTPPAFPDPIADALWAARAAARGIGAFGPLSRSRGEAVADLLYARLREQGAQHIGWKIAATDPAVQRRFGTDRPFTAPLFDASVLPGGSCISLASLVAPVIEAEIGVALIGGLPAVLPCIEIADCRVLGWDVKLAEALADFGLQGAMVLGDPANVTARTVDVTLSHDGEPISRGTAELPAAIGRARSLRDPSAPALAARTAAIVATGAVLPPRPLTAGRWTVSFGPLGSLAVSVVP